MGMFIFEGFLGVFFQHFWTGMLFQVQQNMLIQEHVLLGKITVTLVGKIQ